MRLDAGPLGELPPVTRALALSFFFGWLAHAVFPGVSLYLGLVPLLVTKSGWVWQPFTYLLIHAGFWHFLFNAFMLWTLGRLLEPELGSRRFLLYFLGCGAAAALLTVAWSPASPRPVVGASGAIFGLLGAFAFLYPDAQVSLYFLFPMSARTLAVALGAMELAFTLAGGGGRVSNVTHLGGLAAGLLWLWGERRWRSRLRGAPAREPDPAALERAEIDRLLDKVSARGQAALSRAELARLDAYARRRGGRS